MRITNLSGMRHRENVTKYLRSGGLYTRLADCATDIEAEHLLRSKLAAVYRHLHTGELEDEEERSECIWWGFEQLREFYQKAATAGLPVICTISH